MARWMSFGGNVTSRWYRDPSPKRIVCSKKSTSGQRWTPENDGPHLKFEPDWGGPIFWEGLFIAANDTLAVSLLQARLIDLKLPIKVEEWKGW